MLMVRYNVKISPPYRIIDGIILGHSSPKSHLETFKIGTGEALKQRDVARVRTALTGMEGHLARHSNAAQKRPAVMPWMFDPEVREHLASGVWRLASGCLVLHRLGAEFTDGRAAEAKKQTASRLEATPARNRVYTAHPDILYATAIVRQCDTADDCVSRGNAADP